MKEYIVPKIIIVEIEDSDVIVTSGNKGNGGETNVTVNNNSVDSGTLIDIWKGNS